MRRMSGQRRRSLFLHWAFVAVFAEAGMLIFNRHLALIYELIAFIFLAGLVLRAADLYPGESEPLILDAFAVLAGVVFALMAQLLLISVWRFVLIFATPVIILPHLYYISLGTGMFPDGRRHDSPD